MSKEKIYIFDTTLRDGAQTQGVDFSIDEKNRIATALSKLGVDYIEAGWPGANPTDTNFFNKPPKLSNSILVAFGMTKKSGRSAENDPGLSAILNSNTKSVCIVGKTWDFHVDVALGISKEENLENIVDTTKHFIKNSETPTNNLKKYIKRYNLLKERCVCGLTNNWQNQKLVLQLDHINGDRRDNRLENLRFLCPNCHSQTPNYAGRKPKKAFREWRKDPRPKNRKVVRPDKEQLQNLLNENSFVQIAKMYGVSDNAIRRWCKSYSLL